MATSFVPAGSLRRCVAYVLAASVLSTAFVPATAFAQDAKASLADADKAVKAKDWATAAKLYDAANKIQPSAEALEGLANASYQAGQLGEAHAAYQEWLDKYGAKAAAAKKKLAETRLKELNDKTSAVTITVSEPGAAVFVDDKQVGTSPLPAPVRLSVKEHRIKVTKEGFTPFEQSTNVAAGAPVTVQATLVSTAAKGKVTVREKTGKTVRVIVDNLDVGPAPWTGEADPGSHEITVRGTGLAATPQTVNVERGKSQEIEFVAGSSTASVKIGTSDAKGLIYIDDKLVGEGSFIGDLPSGTHKLRITREGYDPFEEDVVVKDKEPLARTVTLKLSGTITTGPVQEVERLEGVYGGFGLLGFLTPGGTGDSVSALCEDKGKTPTLASCDAPGGLGGGLGGFFGYHWDPIGVELYLAGQYDQRVLNTEWTNAVTDPGIGPDPARLEEYTLRRMGGMGLFRIRGTWQGSKFRFSMAAGAGVALRFMSIHRVATLNNPAEPKFKDSFVSDTVSYVSPVISLEPSVAWRITRGTALTLGLQLNFETPSSFMNGRENPQTAPEGGHRLGARGLSTRSYELASDVQIFVGPTLGLMFGP